MNTERLAALADHIETVPPERFNMGWWISKIGRFGFSIDVESVPDIIRLSKDCGTACCLAGFAIALWPQEALALADKYAVEPEWTPQHHKRPMPFLVGRDLLGLDNQTAESVFTGEPWRSGGIAGWNDRHRAARCLREMVAVAQAENVLDGIEASFAEAEAEEVLA